MSSVVRGFSRLAMQTVRASQAQKRSVGDMPCKTDPHIEAWVYEKENLEQSFKFTNSNLVTIGITVVAIPYVVYNLIIADFNKKDDVYGRKRREFM